MKNLSVPVRLAAFGAALLAALAIGAGLGAAVGPDSAPAEEDPAPAHTFTEMDH